MISTGSTQSSTTSSLVAWNLIDFKHIHHILHRSMGGDLFPFGLRDGPVRALSRSEDLAQIGGDHLLPKGDPNTLCAIVPKLDRAICASCEGRIFRQCPSLVQKMDTAAIL